VTSGDHIVWKGTGESSGPRIPVQLRVAAGAASPWRQNDLPQVRLEPLPKARAEELSLGRIRFGHELTDLQQDEHGVQGLIRDNAVLIRWIYASGDP
jgi:2,4-dichlorophenol 6-monooxygenase